MNYLDPEFEFKCYGHLELSRSELLELRRQNRERGGQIYGLGDLTDHQLAVHYSELFEAPGSAFWSDCITEAQNRGLTLDDLEQLASL